MRWARTGPTPGSWSSCSAVAVLRSTGVPGAAEPGGGRPGGGVPGAGEGRRTPTGICSPSTSLRARLRVPVPAPGRTPPAALMASSTREPDGRVTTPGCLTLPRTWTTTDAGFAAPAGTAPDDGPGDGAAAGTSVAAASAVEGAGSGRGRASQR